MSDDDNTPTERPFRKPRIQTSDDRGAAALQRRSMAPTTPAETVPMPIIDEDPADMTGPFDLFEPARIERRKRPGDSVVELAAKLRRDRPDPYDLLAQLAFEHVDSKEAARKERRANESQSKELDAQFKAFLAQQPGGKRFDELAAAVADLSPVRSSLKWLQRSVIVIVVAIGTWLYARGGKETAIDMKIEALEKTADRLETLVDQMRHMAPSHTHEDHP